MALVTKLRANEIITVNGCRIRADTNVKLSFLDPVDIIYPNGKHSQPPEQQPTDGEASERDI